MILTEEEAKTKWCPETRIHEVRGAGVYVNKPITDENPHGHANAASVMCIGSACMAWRWYGMKVHADGSIYTTREAYRAASGLDQLSEKDKEAAVAVGYCGKAGNP